MLRTSHAALFVALMLSGCSQGALLRGRAAGIRDVLDAARRNGAYRCAPREFALAEANLQFADTELSEGDAVRAEEHLELAEPNARAAFDSSPVDRCTDQPAAPAPVADNDPDHDGIVGAADQCPNVAEDFDGFEDTDGCPEDQDSDGDGVPDSRDACTLEAEDVDNYLDADGCPDPDNDLDGVLDAADHCANDPEDMDGYLDTDGCQDRDNDSDSLADVDDQCPNEPGRAEEHGCPRVYENVQVTGTSIRILQTVHFQFDKAVILTDSFQLLNTVAQVLRDYPTLAVEVQGHTDSRGRAAHNTTLSDARANAVRTYLISQGIDAARLTARGYGATVPLDSNLTDAGRAANRRVEFVRTDAGALLAPATAQ